MDIMETVRTAIQELIVPDLTRIREENKEIKTILTLTNKRLDDVNLHLADQSRRIDETNKRIDGMRDELAKRIDGVRDELVKRIDGVRDELVKRIDGVRDALVKRIDETNKRIDETNKRIDRLYDVVVRREEHAQLSQRLNVMERDMAELKRRIAA
ncbi:MAG: hypothetical protein AUK55_00275 [Syntrophobacteraceae bacterium CG2_30_61_12]|nr:MAG: hypothetical protein AUK55_00275 [Syntrophobacteraceae bacterium CG2_30_61_12]